MGTCRFRARGGVRQKIRKQNYSRTRKSLLRFSGFVLQSPERKKLYFEKPQVKEFLRDKAGEASRDCDGDGGERKEGCAKEIAGAEFRNRFSLPWHGQVARLPRSAGVG